jgi:hypothetical protein
LDIFLPLPFAENHTQLCSERGDQVNDPQRKTEEVIVVARRGPFEAKFDEKGVVLGFREAKVVMLGNENNPWGMAQH